MPEQEPRRKMSIKERALYKITGGTLSTYIGSSMMTEAKSAHNKAELVGGIVLTAIGILTNFNAVLHLKTNSEPTQSEPSPKSD